MGQANAAGDGDDPLVATAIESMRVGLVVLDRAGRVVRHNRCAERLLGAPTLRAPLECWRASCAAPLADGGTAAFCGEFPGVRALRGEPCSVELVWQAGAAAGCHLLVTAAPCLDDTGAAIGAVITFDELTASRPASFAEAAWPARRAEPARPGVLLVESDAAARAESARLLRGAGFVVVEAETASDALRAVAAAVPIDVVLTDLILDDETGPELAHQLLQIRPRLSILYMSDHPWGALLPASGGGRGLLRKPFDADGLIAAVTQAAAGEAASRVDGRAPTELGRVLVVDDDAMLRQAAAALLRDEGFGVIEADDGAAALVALETTEVDAVISDINMPGMTGIDMLRDIRRRDIDVPVILMTAAPRIDSASTAVEYGASRYLAKPVEASALIESVQHAVRSGRLARLKRDAQAIAGHDAWQAGDLAGLEVRLDRALSDLWLEFQPVVRVAGRQVSAYEALVRTGEASMRSPPLLFAAAAQQGRAVELSRAIRRLAAQAVAAAPADAALHVNVNGADLDDDELFDLDAPLSAVAHRVVLEFNERQALTPGPRFGEQIRALRAMGFRLAVDDLGAGPSGIATVSSLAPDLVKLDPTLVRGIHATRAQRDTIAAMIAVCHDMGIEVGAEGVELEAERNCLVELGCDLLQGYLFARPSRGFATYAW